MTGSKLIDFIRKTAFFAIIFLFSYILMVIKNGADPDLWHRMAVGRIFSQLGWITYNDIFSYFPKKEMWVDHEWLSGVIFYYLGAFFGDYGLISLQVIMTFLILFLIYKINQKIFPENKYRISCYLVALLGIHAGLSSTLRCQGFTYLFFTLWIYLLERVRRGETRLIWIFPATMLLWANMHGGFLAGVGLVCFYAAGELLNGKNFSKYLAILGITLPVTLINPYGFEYWKYILSAATMERPYITEWEAFNPLESFYTGLGFKILFVFLILGYGYKLFKRQFNFDKVEIIALAVTFYLAIKHERHSVFFAIVAASYVYPHLSLFLNDTIGKLDNKVSNSLNTDIRNKMLFLREYFVNFFLISASVYIIASIPVHIDLDEYPVKEIEFVKKNNLTGNLFIPFNWGSYALWKLYPQNLVSIDGRFEEVYKTVSYLDVTQFTLLEDQQDSILKKYNHQVFIVGIESSGYKKLKSLPEWQLVYEGDNAAVFIPAFGKPVKLKPPEDSPDYYIKTKYENSIDFRGTKKRDLRR